MAMFAAEVTDDHRLPLSVLADHHAAGQLLISARAIWWRGQFEARMHVLAQGALWAVPGKVIRAEHATNVTVPTVRPVATETPVVPRAVFDFRLRVDVKERTFLIMASIESGIKVTFGHLCHVIFVQKFALVPFLAEASEPMLADDGSITPYVPKRA